MSGTPLGDRPSSEIILPEMPPAKKWPYSTLTGEHRDQFTIFYPFLPFFTIPHVDFDPFSACYEQHQVPTDQYAVMLGNPMFSYEGFNKPPQDIPHMLIAVPNEQASKVINFVTGTAVVMGGMRVIYQMQRLIFEVPVSLPKLIHAKYRPNESEPPDLPNARKLAVWATIVTAVHNGRQLHFDWRSPKATQRGPELFQVTVTEGYRPSVRDWNVLLDPPSVHGSNPLDLAVEPIDKPLELPENFNENEGISGIGDGEAGEEPA